MENYNKRESFGLYFQLKMCYNMLSVGVDEAGRGCIFGPVFAACVIWNDDIEHKLLKDSKKLTKNQRNYMYDFIIGNAIDYGISYSTSAEIDKHNILQATQIAMHRALDKVTLDYDQIFVDGNYFNTYFSNSCSEYKSHTCIVKGDQILKSISAASILAKVSHDNWIEKHSNMFPEYNLSQNMGYCTKQHVEAVKQYGKSLEHRHTFKLPYEKIW